MQRSGQPYRYPGISPLSGEDSYLSDTDPPDGFMPGPAIGPDGLSHSATPLLQDFPKDQTLEPNRRSERSFLGAPLSLRTMNTTMSMPDMYQGRAGTDSPTRQLHPGFTHTPPFPTLMRHTSLEEPTSSPRTERLPSFRQLSKIADCGTEGTETRATSSYPVLPSHPPAMASHSPPKTLPYFSASQQSSPSASLAMLNNPSPTMARPEPPEHFTLQQPPTPYQMPDPSRFAQRRRSFGLVKAPPFQHSLTSSSNETNVSHQSSADSYSTANSTPTEASGFDVPPKPSLTPQMSVQQSPPATGIFHCDYPGCVAPPFQTQYLLK